MIAFRRLDGEGWNLVARDGDGAVRVLAPGGDLLPDSSIRRAGGRVVSGTSIGRPASPSSAGG